MAPFRRSFVALVAAAGLAAGARASAVAGADDPGVAAGIRLVESGEIERAVTALEAALTRLPGENASARAAAHLYLAMAHLALQHGSAARTHLREAWTLRSGAALDPKRFPPRVVEMYEENRPRKTPPTPSPRPTPSPTPEDGRSGTLPFVLGAAAGAGLVGLTRSDASPTPPGPPTVRVFNCDDGCRVWLNGQLLAEVAMGQDSGRIDLAPRLAHRGNVLAFEVTNAHGGISYGFEVRRGESVVFQQVCGVAARQGCENDKPFPSGVARRYEYVL